MSSLSLLLFSALLLLIPWALAPRPVPRPEIHGLLRLLWWLDRFYCGFWHRLETESAPLPDQGPAILISNHTCGIDNFLLQAGCRRVLGFLIVQDWYDNRFAHPFCKLLHCIPVRRDGRDLAATRAALRALEQGRVVPIFPEGRIVPTSGREFAEPKSGVAFLALKAQAPVIPAYIRGTPATTDIGRALMTPSRARVTYGPPIDLSRFSSTHSDHPDRETLSQVAEHLMSAIRALRDAETP